MLYCVCILVWNQFHVNSPTDLQVIGFLHTFLLLKQSEGTRLNMLVLACLGLVYTCTICFRPVRLICAMETGSMLKNWKVAKVELFQNGNGHFMPFMELQLG